MQKYGKLFWLMLVLLMGKSSFAQDWLWIQDDHVLNPSGIDIRSNSTQFQVLDWNGDGLWDFMINETGQIVYYEQVKSDKPFWVTKPLALPAIGFNEYYYVENFPKNFEFFDWDEDGAFDLAADSSRFWWNQGSNKNPTWVQDDSLFGGIEFGYDFFFCDYDGDDDWDATVDVDPYGGAYFYLNEGNNVNPIWFRVDSLLSGKQGWYFYGPIGAAASFTNWNTDDVLDLSIITFVPADPGSFLELSLFLNQGSLLKPEWQKPLGFLTGWAALNRPVVPAYDIINYVNHDLIDIIKTDWRRHIAIHFNQGTMESPYFNYEPDVLLGAVNVESTARPAFFDINNDRLSDLLIAEDYVTSFQWNYYHEGQIWVSENEAGYFNPRNLSNKNFLNLFGYHSRKNSFTLSFSDVDKDGDQDYIIGHVNTNFKDEYIGRGVLYFQNVGTAPEPNWQSDSTHFTYFLEPDSNFYDPRLVDIDYDGDFDLFLQKQGIYTFYERLNTEEESWQENPAWLSGLDAREHYSAVFADLTRDGEEDLVFGESDGTLRLYENVGRSSAPVWQLEETAFAGIDVDSLAAPAFADLDGDHRLDLVVGNADGWLFYFRNESTVDVSSEADSRPVKFKLFQNYPNPFNPETTIEYELAQPGNVQLTIYNLLGQRVRILVDEWQPAGSYRVSWDGSRERGVQRLASGVYVYELKVGGKMVRKKMEVLR